MKLTSAGGLIALLDEPVNDLKEVALHKINQVIDEFWPEVAESVVKIEILHEDDTFAQRELAALIASKIYYHLGHFEDALTYALGAGKYFDVNSSSEFVQTIVAKCIDFYATQSVANFDGATTAKPIDPRLEGIVNKMFDYCLADGQYKQAIGIALETRRMDVFERAIKESGDIPGMLSYALKVTMGLIQNRTFRNEILRSLVRLYQGLATPDYINMVQCLIFLDDSLLVAGTLEKLILSNEADVLMAEQICFDLYESATQQFVTRVINTLKGTTPATAESTDVEKVATEDTAMDTDAQSPPRKKKFVNLDHSRVNGHADDVRKTDRLNLMDRRGLRIATWNVLTLNAPASKNLLSKELRKNKVSIAGLTETSLTGSGEERIGNSDSLLWSGGSLRRNGVGLALNSLTRKALLLHEAVSDRLMKARFGYKHGKMTVIVCHAPTNDSDDATKEDIYSVLSRCLATVPPPPMI
ncbi:26S proteasome non-ATPase regulatory subunit 1-like [Artemia franciscana]|uniref:26S proteasome non-ATPase regulatory subunit 1-like n=1 Tax=Artemia franciscana TaxID=6661 RepID=UPI0032DBCD49